MDYAFSMRSLSYSGVCDGRLEKLSSQINYYEENLMQNTIHEVAAFQSQLAGRIIRPHDADYDSARAVWNGMIDKYPALIVRCASATDVIAAVNFCRDNDVPFSVRGGGHNVAGIAVRDGGLVIDLSEMRGVHVDPEARIARVDGGATWADVDQKTQAFGLATPGGVVSDTGVAGLTLGGGFGWLSKKYGLSCDNLLSVDIVTADGRLLKASETENADLFWGVRGGGGNFGIVVSFEFQLHPVGPDVYRMVVFHPGDKAREFTQFFREYTQTLSDDYSGIGVLGHFPEVEAFPVEAHGKSFIAMIMVYAGDDFATAERQLRPLREFTTPVIDLSGAVPFVEAQTFFDEDYPAGDLRYYWKSRYVTGLHDEVIDALIELNDESPSHHSTIDLWILGGAVSRVPASATAFGDRSAPNLIGVEANWEHSADDDANIAWARKAFNAMEPFAQGGQYLNFPGFYEEGESLIRATYGENYQRLAELKNKYDPSNLFNQNQNIKPIME
jgi:FAD/FMN-containing dehydrogenase